MLELTAETVRDYLVDHGRIADDEPVAVECLAGGVSNLVLKISPRTTAPFVLKQSRAQLRTKADWFSRVERIFREAEAQRALSPLLSPRAVPRVLFEDRENFCFAMSAIRPDHAVWKLQLLSHIVDPMVFELAGGTLGDIHAKSAGHPELLADPQDTVVFFELRVDPFYRRIADVHPSISSAVARLIEEMEAHSICLVHADFSPKNLLVHPDGLSLVDYETVHYGDPAFDLGFFFSHLWLKAVALPSMRTQLIDGIEQAWKSYQTQLNATPNGISLLELSRRAVPHLAACLLSRVDGKSPVDYLTQTAHQEFVRGLALRWLHKAPANFDDALRLLAEDVSSIL